MTTNVLLRTGLAANRQLVGPKGMASATSYFYSVGSLLPVEACAPAIDVPAVVESGAFHGLLQKAVVPGAKPARTSNMIAAHSRDLFTGPARYIDSASETAPC